MKTSKARPDRYVLTPFDPVHLFQASARRWPERTALLLGGRSFTYAQLATWSDAIAARLIDAGARGERVALVASREAATYASILGILKAGCSYVPLPPDGPPARWSAMLQRAHVVTGIAHPALDPFIGRAVPNGTADPVPARSSAAIATGPDDEAYVLFTSGSTGGPKGVSVSRANVAAYLQHLLGAYAFSPEDRFTQFFALTFDLSVHDLFVCWGAGACLCVPDDDAPLRAAAFAREQRITIWFSVPTLPELMLRMRSLRSNALPELRLAFFCGEPLPRPIAKAFAEAAPAARLINLYGPTETTIAITAHEITPDDLLADGIVPIGRAFPRHVAIVRDEELLLSGPQVGRGYVNDEAAKAHAFVALPDHPGRWYRTGDRVRQDADGTLHHLGRTDDQVKVRGHRVEPAEVDAVIAPLLAGGRSVTVPFNSQGSTRLATFIDVPMEERTLLDACRDQLPAYMVPERIIVLDQWPLNAHGKTDRRRLTEIAAHG